MQIKRKTHLFFIILSYTYVTYLYIHYQILKQKNTNLFDIVPIIII